MTKYVPYDPKFNMSEEDEKIGIQILKYLFENRPKWIWIGELQKAVNFSISCNKERLQGVAWTLSQRGLLEAEHTSETQYVTTKITSYGIKWICNQPNLAEWLDNLSTEDED